MTETNVKDSWQERPPVVAVLGHVDHGKTSLLDRIRKTHVADRETGGITQAIGAYQIDFKGKKITFIDTPGHAAFNKMRARGGQAADLVILVVAVDDGVMPQTIESIGHIQEANVPFLVAINKTDLPSSDIEKVKGQLAENGVYLEGYGGDVVAVPVSAKTGAGVDELLEMIGLLSQIHEIKGDPNAPLQAVVIESKKEKAGSVGTVVVKNGSLSVGDQILAGGVEAKVRGLMDENGKRLSRIGPGEAAEVLGFVTPPPVGAEVLGVTLTNKPQEAMAPVKIPVLTEEEEKKFKIILKTDTRGSLEALLGSLGDEVYVVSQGVGEIVEADIFLAKVVKARVYGFRIKVSPQVQKRADDEKVEIRIFNLIYQFLESIQDDTEKALHPRVEEKVMGKAEVIAEFFVAGSRIAGCKVLDGKLVQGMNAHLNRGEKTVGDAQISSLKQRTKDVNEVRAKEECGVFLDPALDFRVGDMILSFKI